MRAVTYLDRRGRVWREGSVSVVDGRVQLCADAPETAVPRLDGVITGGFTDSHVHLQLVDAEALADSSLARVFDLGGNPAVLSRMTSDVEIGFAGAFLTPPGGYPSDRAWAPTGSFREISDPDAAASAIAEMKAARATCVKVASNSTAGPVFDDELFAAIVEIAGRRNMSVIAHAEGPGEAQRATRLRARVLAHAPFTERLSDAELHAMLGSVSWSSTLAVHEGEAYEIAVDNVRRFHALGGIVVYGTDMGNGPTPVGLNPREIAALRDAGIDGPDLLRSLVPVDPTTAGARLNFFPGAAPDTTDPLLARPLTPADLEA